MGSTASVSKISSKRDSKKMSVSSSKKNKTEEEGNEYIHKDGQEEFDETKDKIVKYNEITSLNVRNWFELCLLKLRFKLSC